MTALDLRGLRRATLDEIIFEHRNQAYGAFELRRTYEQRLKRSVAGMLLLCALIPLYPVVSGWLTGTEAPAPAGPVLTPNEDYVLTEMPPIEVPVTVTPAPPITHVNTKQFTPPRVIRDAAPEPVAALTTMAQANEATNLGPTTVTDGAETPATLSVVEAPAAAPAEPSDVPLAWSEQMPEFPGGLEALRLFVAHHTKFPPLAIRNSVEGKVYVKFIVDETGAVQHPEVVRGIGAGCDEAALAVVRALPRFTPGRQNGRAVKVYFSLPVSFVVR